MEVNFINNNYIFQQKVHFSYILSSRNVYKSGYFEKKMDILESGYSKKVDFSKSGYFDAAKLLRKWIFFVVWNISVRAYTNHMGIRFTLNV